MGNTLTGEYPSSWDEEDVEEWSVEADYTQKMFYHIFQGTQFVEYDKESEEELVSKICLAINGTPKIKQAGKTNHSAEQLEEAKRISHKIKQVWAMIPAENRPKFSIGTIFICCKQDKNQFTLPIFKLLYKIEGSDHSFRFIDTTCRVYEDWDDWKKNNSLPMMKYCYPEQGFYACSYLTAFAFQCNEDPDIEYGTSPASPEKKRKKLNAALAEAIGVTTKKSEENIEKPIALALISDDKSAASLLSKIQAQNRPKEVLESTLNVCKVNGDDAHVGEPFRQLFSDYFRILGIESAQNCWDLLFAAISSAENVSKNETAIICDFINSANLLGNGFSKLVQKIKLNLAETIKNFYASERIEDAGNLGYSLICLLLAENAYCDEDNGIVIDFWKENVEVEEMQKSPHFALLHLLALGSKSTEKWPKKSLKKLESHPKILEIFQNHIEFFAVVLEENTVVQLLKMSLEKEEKLKMLARRCGIAGISGLLTKAVLEVGENPKIIDFLTNLDGVIEGKEDLFAIFNLLINSAETSIATQNLLRKYAKTYPEIFQKFVKKSKNAFLRENFKGPEMSETKYVNRTAEEINQVLLEEEQVDLEKICVVLKSVHTWEVKQAIFENLTKLVENLEGGENPQELDLYKQIIRIYANSNLESLAIQLILTRLASDDWPENRKNSPDVLTKLTELLDVMIRDAKNSIIKNFTAIFCQLFSDLLRSVQRFLRNSENFGEEEDAILRKHKLIQDISRIVDLMKRHESYFSMLAASMISDTVFNGSATILTMAKLHSLADRNASALLATNLPVVERTRYSKFLPIITKASKKVF
ncbi:unnamed protein product [Caenorhabditis angaria]|uniref:DUF4781 domain-containing protein n=1 Tax=Caenorhabditis angaria TaxID=860376 RepID=A0A9P1MYZ3_9PELO|nr:unnamed protein product [Caenorhabditis angaria]